jgi:hypothetical protein
VSSTPPRFLGAQFPDPHPPGPSHPGKPPSSTRVGGATPGVTGLVERWMVFGEGSCFSVVTLFLPLPVNDMHSPRPSNLSAVVFYQVSISPSLSCSLRALTTLYGLTTPPLTICALTTLNAAMSHALTKLARGTLVNHFVHRRPQPISLAACQRTLPLQLPLGTSQ